MADERRGPSPTVTPKILQDVGLFGGMGADTLEVLAKELPVKRAEVGEMIVREGEPAREMFVVVQGELEVLKKAHGGENDVRVALFGPGDWFGEMAILDVQPRSASVRALAPTFLLQLGSDDVENLLYRRDLRGYALFIMNIARELSRRLRVADGILAQFVGSVENQYIKRRR